jgi:thiol-disulfide isomerase/thioredoxin
VEFPHFEQLYQELKAKGVEIVAVNTVQEDLSRVVEQARQYRRYHSAQMPILFTNEWPLGYVVLDGRGKVVYDGDFQMEQIRAAIQAILED